MRKFLFLGLFLVLISGFSTYAQVDGSYNELIIRHDGLDRRAHIYEPAGEVNGVVIALHELYSSARAMEAITGLNTLADQNGWVIVYPEAFHPYWDDGRVEAGLPPILTPVDDVGFLSTLSATIKADYNVEDVYLVGHGAGGTMAMTAGCQTPESYSGVAVVSALMWTYQLSDCDNTEASNGLDTLFIIGNQDHIYHEAGRVIIENSWEILSTQATFNYWTNRNNCTEIVNNDARNSSLQLQTNCTDGTSTAMVTILNGGHAWARTLDGQRLNQTGLDATEIIGGFFSGDDDWQASTQQSEITEDLARSYVLYVPTSYDPSTPTPVVIGLHGRGANAFSQARSSGYNAVAEEHGFIVLYPQAFDPNFNTPNADAVWNYNLGLSVSDPRNWDDDTFLDNLVDDLALTLNIDMNRLYVSGLSNGGYMTNRLACTRGDRYAAFASVAASAPFGLQEICEEGVHAPITYYHGTDDTISPWDGAVRPHPITGQDSYLLAPIPNSLAFWVDQNECGNEFSQVEIPSTDPDSSVTLVEYTNCPNDSAVQIFAVIGGGHVWPGIYDFDSDFLGEVNMDINASQAIWAFFSGYTLDGYDESLAVEFDLGIEEAVVEIEPTLPPTPETSTTSATDTPSYEGERAFIEALQDGGFSVYIPLDLTAEASCDSTLLDETQQAQLEAIAQSFTALEIIIGEVTVADDCRAIAVGELFTDNPTTTSAFNANSLNSLITAVPDGGTLSIFVGDATLASSVTGVALSEGQSLLFRPIGDGSYQIVATVPQGGWSDLADIYDTILETTP